MRKFSASIIIECMERITNNLITFTLDIWKFYKLYHAVDGNKQFFTSLRGGLNCYYPSL